MNMNVTISSADQNIILVDGREYSLAVIPDFADPLVQREAQRVLGQLSLGEVTENLNLSVELFHVAYNGVAGADGGKIQAKIALLQADLARLCNECVLTMSVFALQTEEIINLLRDTHRWLVKGQEGLAIKKLGHCKEASTSMSSAAKALADRFTVLQKESAIARSDTLLQEASERDRKLAAEQQEREILAKQVAEKANQEALVADAANAQVAYEEAKSREEREASHQLVMGIVGAICGAVGTGLGAFAAAQNPALAFANKLQPTGDNAAQIKQAQDEAKSAKKASDEAQAALIDNQGQQEGLQTEIKTQKDAIAAATKAWEAKSAEAESDEEQLSKLKADRQAAEAKLADLDKQLKSLQTEAKKLELTANSTTSAYSAAAAAMTSLTGSVDQMAKASQKVEDSIRDEKMRFLNRKLELENEKRQSLVALATYAQTIANLKVEEGNAELSVASLHAAVSALGKIIGTLTQASLFWDQMAAYCRNMSDGGLQREIADVREEPQEVRQIVYNDEAFVLTFLKYICQWVAVNGLSAEYLAHANEAQKQAVAYLQESPTIEEAIRRAPELAKKLEQMVERGLKQSRESSIELQQMRAIAQHQAAEAA